MIELRNGYWAVEVPDGANDFTIVEHKVRNLIDERDLKRVEWHDSDKPTRPFLIIPPGTWQIIGTSKEATEGHAKQIVERTHSGGFGRSGEEFKDYVRPGACFSALASLKTLLTSKGCDTKQNLLILKKQ